MEAWNVVVISLFKLDASRSDNYFLRCPIMQLILRAEGVWRIVTGDVTALNEDVAEGIKTDFEKRCDVALTIFLPSVDDSCVESVLDTDNPSEVWARLQELYQTFSRARVDALVEQHQGIRTDPAESVMSSVNRLSVLETQLASIGHEVSRFDKQRIASTWTSRRV